MDQVQDPVVEEPASVELGSPSVPPDRAADAGPGEGAPVDSGYLDVDSHQLSPESVEGTPELSLPSAPIEPLPTLRDIDDRLLAIEDLLSQRAKQQ
jgi:hypothetical protein